MVNLDTQMLAGLEPVSSLSPGRIAELVKLCQLQHFKKDQNPFRQRGLIGQSVYLIRGRLSVSYEDGNKVVITSGSEWAKHPIGKRQPAVTSAKAMTDLDLIRIDDDLLDIMVTWDQLGREWTVQRARAVSRKKKPGREFPDGVAAREATGESLGQLTSGIFSELPPHNVEALLKRMEKLPVRCGEVIVREGEEGDFYYVIEAGAALVSRRVGGVTLMLAELKSGDPFGEEALISQGRRNATVTMKTDGVLLRLDKKDFAEFVTQPLLKRLPYAEAKRKIDAGAAWLDVRFPPEYRHDRLPGAINIPLGEIRSAIGVLDREREYVCYCQSGRRSSAAAFILAQRGYKIYVLEGGLWTLGRETSLQ